MARARRKKKMTDARAVRLNRIVNRILAALREVKKLLK